MSLDGDESGRSLWWVFPGETHVEAGSGCLVRQGVHQSSTWLEDGVEEELTRLHAGGAWPGWIQCELPRES